MTRSTWTGLRQARDAPDETAITVTIEREFLRIEGSGAPAEEWSYRAVRLTHGLQAEEPVRIEHLDTGEALVISDRAFLDSVRRLAPGAALSRRTRKAIEAATPESGPHGGPSGQPRVVVWVMGTIAAVVAAYFWVLPAVGGLLAMRVPVSWEVDLGNSVADVLAPPDSVCNDPLLIGAIDGIVDRLAASLPDSPYDFRVSVADDTLVNAFAAPGGRIVVMRGLLENSATPEELAGVLAHEMQHVELRHGTRALLRALPLTAALSVMGGGSGGSAAMVGTLGALRYARGDESEADREGMRLLHAARVDPAGMIAFFETLEAEVGSTAPALAYFSTHPATEERRARLADLAAEASEPAAPIDLPAEWSTITTSCRAPR